jgi:hypothetical protein
MLPDQRARKLVNRRECLGELLMIPDRRQFVLAAKGFPHGVYQWFVLRCCATEKHAIHRPAVSVSFTG